jgi:hypothetical protein
MGKDATGTVGSVPRRTADPPHAVVRPWPEGIFRLHLTTSQVKPSA